jgi:integrase
MVILIFGTGLRRGEPAGLKWEDIDFEDKEFLPARSLLSVWVE